MTTTPNDSYLVSLESREHKLSNDIKKKLSNCSLRRSSTVYAKEGPRNQKNWPKAHIVVVNDG